MANVRLGTKAVGSIVKINVNGTAKDFIIVHQGIPDAGIYDDSCTGTWLLMKDIYENRQWNSSSPNDYANSTIHSYLNSTFLNLFDSNFKNAIKQVKLPYRKGSGASTTVTSGSNGLSAKIFLLSATETGFNFSYAPSGEGAELAYFKGCSDGGSDSKRIAYLNGSAIGWWLRSPDCRGYSALYVSSNGDWGNFDCSSSRGIRPALILPSTLSVSGDGTVSGNAAPAINASSTNLGEQNAPFDFNYTIDDANGDTLTVTEKLDGKTTATRAGVVSGTALTFGQGSTAENFQRILNGSHTIQITVSDGKESTSLNATFTKAVHKATVTLAEPLAVEGDITVAILQVSGSIPDDAAFKAEATNNALDDSPVWQDVTEEVRKGMNIIFKNQTASAGAAFNFRISVERGASGEGGYIDSVSGAFQ